MNRSGFMPRNSRLKSSTGYHHIMLRGINRNNIFESDQDKDCFLNSLYRAREKSSFKVIGYCLKMPLAERAKLIKDVYQETGASIRDLSRGLGMGRSIIGELLKCDKRNVPLSFHSYPKVSS
jgi:hypothetical protein